MAEQRKETDRLDRPQGEKPSLGGKGREAERPDLDEKRQESIGGTQKEARESAESGTAGGKPGQGG